MDLGADFCPDCGFDFLCRRGDNEFWLPSQKALAEAALAANVAALEDRAAGFENSLWPGQRQSLLAALRQDERRVDLRDGARAVAAAPAGPGTTAQPRTGWYPDPWREARLRWWDGARWTPSPSL